MSRLSRVEAAQRELENAMKATEQKALTPEGILLRALCGALLQQLYSVAEDMTPDPERKPRE